MISIGRPDSNANRRISMMRFSEVHPPFGKNRSSKKLDACRVGDVKKCLSEIVKYRMEVKYLSAP